MKQRFTYLDLEVIKNELQAQIDSYRLQNIYELASSSRQFVFRFQTPTAKKALLVDPGFRIHLTEYSRSIAPTPSGFVAKLRKHLKTRRLKKISLAKGNRTLIFSFSDDLIYHLVFEFFSGGNLLLLDKEYKILALQRTVTATDTHARYAVGEDYDIKGILEDDQQNRNEQIGIETLKSWLKSDPKQSNNEDQVQEFGGEKKSRKKDRMTLKRLLYTRLPGVASSLLESYLDEAGIDANMNNTRFHEISETELESIVQIIARSRIATDEIIDKDKVPGYIISHKRETDKTLLDSKAFVPDQSITDEYIYENFEPIRPKNIKENEHILETSSFNEAVDKYFSTIEAVKLSQKFTAQEIAALRKLEAAKSEKQKRVAGLTDVQEKNEALGIALQTYAERVEEACAAVKQLIDQGRDWLDIENVIKIEQSRGNPVAKMIALPLKLAKSIITVILPDPNDAEIEEDSDVEISESESDDSVSDDQNKQKEGKTVKVDVNLGLSVWANARKYFNVRRAALVKQEKTEAQSDAAYKRAERKIQHDLKKSLESNKMHVTDLQRLRDPFWFEKFYWFRSSDGYLCVAGRDSVQNELLLRKYFKKKDIYVHSDVEGASVVIIKNHLESSSVPPSTLSQAGTFSVTSSTKAWDSKIIMSAWWATRDQIPLLSKEGEPVSVDFIVVKGEGKHFLPPTQMDMGFGFLWLVPEESKEKYGPITGVDKREMSLTEQKEKEEEDESSDEDFPDTNAFSDDEDYLDTQMSSDDEKIMMDGQEEEVRELSNSSDDGMMENDPHGEDMEECEKESSPESAYKKTEEESDQKETAKESDTSRRNDFDTVPDHVTEIEKALESLQMKKKNRDSSLLKPASKKKLKKQNTPRLTPTEKAKSKKEEQARSKRENEIKRRERAKETKNEQLSRLLAIDDDEETSGQLEKYAFECLVPRLVAGDQPLAAVPVFGPWSSMQKFKYKIKIQPGATKKGKAVKDIMHGIFSAKTDPNGRDVDYAWPNELNLLRGVKESAMVLTITVGKVKVSVPGVNSSSKGGNKPSKGSKKK